MTSRDTTGGSNTMHVLFLSTRSPWPLNGGHPLRTFHLLREAARRHRVSFLTFIQHEEEWEGLSVMEEFCDSVVALPVPSDASRGALAAALARNVASTLPFVAQKYDTPAMRDAVRKVAGRAPVDLLHLDMLPLAVYARAAGPVPVVLTDHNVEYVLLERRAKTQQGATGWFWRAQARRLRRFEAAAVRAATRTIAVSDVDAATLRALVPGANVHVVPNGVDGEFFQPGAEPEDPDALVFVGAMTHHPNVDSVKYFVEEIWPRIRAARPGARLTVIGAHPPQSIRTFGDTPGITVAGQVPDIRPYVQRAAVYVVPLRAGGGTRLKILDAMAMGKAIVSTSVGCEGLEVADGCDIAVADTPEAFAQRTLSLMDDAAARAAMGRAARATVEARYGWERLGALQEDVYQKAVADIHRPPG
jgi:sugar transferase (PEP-CTERM/EpsH1 system associated)